jgi:hypothetical protein
MNMNARPIALTTIVALLLLLPSGAAGKSMYGLRLGNSIVVESAIAPTLFASQPCINVVKRTRGDGADRNPAGITKVEARRRYWQMLLFAGATPAQVRRANPTMMLSDVQTGETISVKVTNIFGATTGAYTTRMIRFPHPGSWTVALGYGLGLSYDYANATVVSTVDGPSGSPLTAAELASLPVPHPTDCATTPAPGGSGGTGGSMDAPLAIGLGAAGLLAALAFARGLRRRRALA